MVKVLRTTLRYASINEMCKIYKDGLYLIKNGMLKISTQVACGMNFPNNAI